MSEQVLLDAARAGDELAFRRLIEPFLHELKAHCYRMAGSLHEADDLMQESLLRAWRAIPRFEGRSSLRTWLHRVATTACLDALDKEQRRSLPRALAPAAGTGEDLPPPRNEPIWIEPWPDLLAGDLAHSPEAQMTARESVALAFLTVLQTLPAKQRAVLLLRDVLGWQATECASLLGTSVAAVTSLLQRARETLAREGSPRTRPSDEQPGTGELLLRYVRAWEDADVDGLVSLLHEDATLSMPPYPSWFQGRQAIGRSIRAMVLPPEARGRFRLVPTRANGEPGFAAYALDPPSGRFHFAAIHVVTVRSGAIEDITAFLDPSLCERFGLPSLLDRD